MQARQARRPRPARQPTGLLDWRRRKGATRPAASVILVVATCAAAAALALGLGVECREGPGPSEQTPPPQHSARVLTSQSERQLRSSLNESLARLLQASDEKRAPQAAPLAPNGANSTGQQQSLNALANKKISCDELSLLVLAQRVLNMSATSGALSRLVECKQENLLDSHLLDMFEQRPLAPARTPVQGPQAPPQAHQPPPPQFDEGPLAAGFGDAQPEVLRRHKDERELPASGRLHFGAKVAISLLATVIMLVAAATLVDYQLERARTRAHKPTPSAPESRWRLRKAPAKRADLNHRNHHHHHHQQQHSYNNRQPQQQQQGGQHAAKLRDYRSLSMSSNCSSNLFCSTSSVASSSAPILGGGGGSGGGLGVALARADNQHHHHQHPPHQPDHHHHHHQQQQQQQQQQSAPPQQPNSQRLYETNLQLHFCQQSSCSSNGNGGGSGAGATGKQAEQTPEEFAYHFQYPHSQQHASMATVREEGAQGKRARSLGLARGVLLAFSLRQSARQIFEQRAPARPRAHAQTAPRTAENEHDEEPRKWESEREGEREHEHEHERESVDSLHGLRFLSMIWVIVIHSYTFALRWMFFSNASALEGIYKSAASQLIANGSFACDSFFFAGGFLLPYLACRPRAPTGAPVGCGGGCGGGACAHERSDAEEEHDEGPAEEGQQHVQEHEQEEEEEEECEHADAGAEAPATCCCAACSSDTRASTCCCACYLAGGACGACQQARAQDAHTDERRAPLGGRAVPAGRACPLAAHARSPRAIIATIELPTAAARQTRPKMATTRQDDGSFACKRILANVCHRYARMMPLMMAIIGLCSSLLRYLGEGPLWRESTLMYDEWCRRNWWVNGLFLHNFIKRENMCLSHSWYSAVDFQLFLVGQLVLWTLHRSARLGYLLLGVLLASSPLLTMALTLRHHLPAVPLVSNVSEQTMNYYYGQIYIKPYSRASPYLIGMLLAYALRRTRLAHWRPKRWHLTLGWCASLGTFAWVLMAMQPAMNGHEPSELQSALYSAWSRPLWACATGWMIFACIRGRAGPIGTLLSARAFVPLSKLTYPAFLVHPIVMALFYGSRASSFQFSHYLMLYLILGNIVITYASAFVLAALFELPLLSIERLLSKRIFGAASGGSGGGGGGGSGAGAHDKI